MNKNKGFTLLELLAVMVILSLIALIIVPIIGNVIKESGDKVSEEQHKTIIRAAQKWSLANSGLLPINDGGVYKLKFQELKNSAYFDNIEVIDPATGNEMDGCIIITYSATTEDYKYEYQEKKAGKQPCE